YLLLVYYKIHKGPYLLGFHDHFHILFYLMINSLQIYYLGLISCNCASIRYNVKPPITTSSITPSGSIKIVLGSCSTPYNSLTSSLVSCGTGKVKSNSSINCSIFNLL